MSFTPGPWKYEAHDDDGFFRFYDIVAESGRTLGTIDDEDDAKVMAAAPELLEACEAANVALARLAMDGGISQDLWSEVQQKLQAAIKKARGQ